MGHWQAVLLAYGYHYLICGCQWTGGFEQWYSRPQSNKKKNYRQFAHRVKMKGGLLREKDKKELCSDHSEGESPLYPGIPPTLHLSRGRLGPKAVLSGSVFKTCYKRASFNPFICKIVIKPPQKIYPPTTIYTPQTLHPPWLNGRFAKMCTPFCHIQANKTRTNSGYVFNTGCKQC